MLTAVLVGCGAMSVRWLEAIAKIGDLQLVGLVDLDGARAQARAAEFGLADAVLGSDLDAVLAATRPDIVFDVVTPQARRHVVTTAFAAGCHVLSEKPLATTMEDARAILEAARRHARLHAVTQNRRYVANVRRLKRFLDLRRVGTADEPPQRILRRPAFRRLSRSDGSRLADGHGDPHVSMSRAASPVGRRVRSIAANGTRRIPGTPAARRRRRSSSSKTASSSTIAAVGARSGWERAGSARWRIVCERGTACLGRGRRDARSRRVAGGRATACSTRSSR